MRRRDLLLGANLMAIPASLRRNWVMFDLPVGSKVRLSAAGVTQVNEVRAGGSYLSQHDRRLHFGLGSAAMIDSIEIFSPKGERRVLTGQRVNRIVR